MKKVFFGLAVAAVALGASAFTNAQTLRTDAYLSGVNSSGTVYDYSSGAPNCPTDDVQPCRIRTVGDYQLPTDGTIPAADVNNPDKITILSYRTAF